MYPFLIFYYFIFNNFLLKTGEEIFLLEMVIWQPATSNIHRTKIHEASYLYDGGLGSEAADKGARRIVEVILGDGLFC